MSGVHEVHDNLFLTRKYLVGVFRLRQVPWNYGRDNVREDMLESLALAYCHLPSDPLLPKVPYQIRVTHRAFSVDQWARARDTDAHSSGRSPLNKDQWRADLVSDQHYLARRDLGSHEAYLIAPIARRSTVDRVASGVAPRRVRLLADRAHRRHLREFDRVDAKIETFRDSIRALGAVPATDAEVEWLLHRSLGLGLPSPSEGSYGGGLEEADMESLYDSASAYPVPGSKALRIVGHADRYGSDVERLVRVASLGRFSAELDVPQQHMPWIAESLRLDFPTEWSVRFGVKDADRARKEVGKRVEQIRDQRLQYAEHAAKIDMPRDLADIADDAAEIQRIIAQGDVVDSTQVDVWARVAFSATTLKDLDSRERALRRVYGRMQIGVEVGRLQSALYREFQPDASLVHRGHRRAMPARTFAAAVPQVSVDVGTRSGPYRGNVILRGVPRSPFRWNMWEATENNASGLTPVIGIPGSGKSATLGGAVDDAVSEGAWTTSLDPSGPFANLAALPRYDGQVGLLDLLRSSPGTLSPWGIIPIPNREVFREDPTVLALEHRVDREARAEELFREAVDDAGRTRKTLAHDVCRMLLPDPLLEHRATDTVLMDAIRATGTAVSGSLMSMAANLRQHDDPHGTTLANYLTDMSDMARVQLFWTCGAEANDFGHVTPESEKVGLIITMAGLTMPDRSIPRSHWTWDSLVAVPLLHLAAHYVTRRIYSLPMRERKLVTIDEAHFLAEWASGKALFTRLARDSRKWNARVLAASQKPGDLLGLDVGGLVDEVLIGRVEHADDQRQCLDLLRVPTGVGYESTLGRLSPRAAVDVDDTPIRPSRQWLMRDYRGRVEMVDIDLHHRPDVLKALNTTADGARGTHARTAA